MPVIAATVGAAAALLTGLLAAPAPASPAPSSPAPALKAFVTDEVAEGDAAHVTVVLDQASAHDVTVRLDTRAGTALAPADYRSLHRTVTVPAGLTRVRLLLRTVDDRLDERRESLEVRLRGASGAEVSRAAATLVIRDDDPPPDLRVVDAELDEPTFGHRLGYTHVRLSEPSGRRVVVGLVTRNGTAVAGQDFVRLYPTVVLPPGRTTGVVSVELLADSRVERAEVLHLAVTSARHVGEVRNGRITILDAPGG